MRPLLAPAAPIIRKAVAALALLLAASGAPAATPPSAPSRAAAFDQTKLTAIDDAVARAIADRKIPGGVLWIERDGQVHRRVYGNRVLEPVSDGATEDTIYDAASLTKVIATTTAVMQLVERGRLRLDDPVSRHLPAFAQHGKEAITVRHLLTHMSGLRPGIPANPPWTGIPAAVERACAEKPQNPPDAAFVYSDINFILLGEIVRLAGGRPLDVHTREEVFGPLRMTDTGFTPPADKLPRIAPTERVDGRLIHGVVHDPTARRMGGVAGHAGLFLTAADLARFCRMVINGGELDGVRVLDAASVAEMTRVQNDGSSRRGLGWDIDTSYSGPRGRWLPAGRTFGHTGWTGTSVWIDPAARTFIIFLSNRVHPDGKGDATPIRREIATLAAEAMGRDREAVLNGIDVLVREDFARLRGLRVGLITNHSGRDRQGRSTIDLLHGAPGVKLTALFSPEPRPRARRVDQREHRYLELLRELHEPQRLPIALGMRHPEVAAQVLLRVAAALVPDDHHRLAFETRPAGEDGGVFAKQPIAVQLDEIGEGQPDVVRRERAAGNAGHLHALQRRQRPVNLHAQLTELLLKRHQLLFDVEGTVGRESLQLLDLLFELRQRTLELENRGSSHNNPGKGTPRSLAAGTHKAHTISAKQRAKIV